MNKSIKILTANDHQLMIDGIKGIWKQDDRFVIAAEATNGQSAYDKIDNNAGAYDVLLIYKQYQKQKNEDEQVSKLSAREKEILLLIVDELTSEEIAEKLFISKKTVDNHRQNLLEKTKCKSTVGLVKFAIKNGLEQQNL